MLPHPVIFGKVYDWYWIVMIISIVICSLFFIRLVKKNKPTDFKLHELIIILYAMIIIGFIGSRAFGTIESFLTMDYSFYQFDFAGSFLNGIGHRWYGSLLFALLLLTTLLIIYSRDKWLLLFDAIMITSCLSLVIGKWGCFLSGHYGCYGTLTDLIWGCKYPHGSAPTQVPVHPIQVYDSLFHLLLFPLLIYVFKTKKYGLAGILFLLATSVYNFFIEYIRTNQEVCCNLNLAQFTYLFLFFISGISYLIIFQLKIHNKNVLQKEA